MGVVPRDDTDDSVIAMVSARLGRLRLRALGALLVLPALVSAATTLNVTITKNTTVDIPITLGGGYMWEVCSMDVIGLFERQLKCTMSVLGYQS